MYVVRVFQHIPCVVDRRRDNPLYVSMSGEKSRDANHVTSTGACSQRCLLILVVTCLILATAAVALAIISIAILFTGASYSSFQTTTQ